MLEKDSLAKIVGHDRVRDDDVSLAQFSRDQSFAPSRRPDVVVYPETVEEIQSIVRYANEVRIPITPFSSGLNFHGAAVPDHGGILLNLSHMNKIVLIDEKNLLVTVEPGVTYQQLQEYLLERG
ncbi:MAG: FAD-binding oxidoreductase, partial [Deltaproteobacteria bacterium]|nr:FAD-binding oxidoreductase [Deltaproteobacteria bacterium]